MPLKDNWVDGEQVAAADINEIAEAVNANESAIGGRAPAVHSHSADDITGVLDIERIPLGSSGETVCAGNDPRLSNTRTPTDNTVSTPKIQARAVTPAKLSPEVYAPRVGSVASGATITADAESHAQFHVTALAADATIAEPTGSSVDGQMLLYRIRDNGTARALTWHAAFRPVGVDLPSTTTPSKTMYVGTVRNAVDAAWDVIAVGEVD